MTTMHQLLLRYFSSLALALRNVMGKGGWGGGKEGEKEGKEKEGGGNRGRRGKEGGSQSRGFFLLF